MLQDAERTTAVPSETNDGHHWCKNRFNERREKKKRIIKGKCNVR